MFDRTRWLLMSFMGLAGCSLLGPPGAKPTASPPVAVAGPAAFTPHSWQGSVDRQGPAPLSVIETGTSSEDWESLMPDDSEADVDDAWMSGGTVDSVLAMPEDRVTFDVPTSDDERVQQWVKYLSTGRGRKSFSRWLARSTRYVPIFWTIIEQYDLPKDLVFLCMVESGFSPRAYSWAHAAGPWQFIASTGRRYGLKIGFWVDQRRDFVRSTHAAAQYLGHLYGRFDDWYLAFAAYNGGPGRVSRAIRGTRSDDFWRISRTRRLRRETKHYVPKILAAAKIAKQPAKYGFDDVKYLPPLEWDTLTVNVATDLKTVAEACGLPETEPVELLNPELRCKVTPPGESYPLRVPKGWAAKCQAGLDALSPSERYTYRYHELTSQDSLSSLAKKYTTTATAISSFNELKNGNLKEYEELVVPIKLADAIQVPIASPPARRFRPAVYGPASSQLVIHRVRSGDSLWRIARRYRVSIRKLRLWNGLWRTNTLRIGQRIRIHGGRRGVPRAGRRAKVRGAKRHRVRAGESLWSIAVRHGTSVDRLCRLNGIKRSDKLQIGRVLKLP